MTLQKNLKKTLQKNYQKNLQKNLKKNLKKNLQKNLKKTLQKNYQKLKNIFLFKGNDFNLYSISSRLPHDLNSTMI